MNKNTKRKIDINRKTVRQQTGAYPQYVKPAEGTKPKVARSAEKISANYSYE